MFKEGVQLSNTAIVYASSHHYNTKKIVYAMAEECKIDIFDLKEAEGVDLSAYNHIGFASGIYYGKFDRKLTEFIKNLSLRSEEHTSELQSRINLVCRLLLEKKKEKDYRDAQ